MSKSKRLEALESRMPKAGVDGAARERLLAAIETIMERRSDFVAHDGWFTQASPAEVAAYAMRDGPLSDECKARMIELSKPDTPSGKLFTVMLGAKETSD